MLVLKLLNFRSEVEGNKADCNPGVTLPMSPRLRPALEGLLGAHSKGEFIQIHGSEETRLSMRAPIRAGCGPHETTPDRGSDETRRQGPLPRGGGHRTLHTSTRGRQGVLLAHGVGAKYTNTRDTGRQVRMVYSCPGPTRAWTCRGFSQHRLRARLAPCPREEPG